MNNTLSSNTQNMLVNRYGRDLTYTPEKNVYLTMGYTSSMGNTYYKAFRMSDQLIVCYEIGEGYKYTFLNGISIILISGQKMKLIAQRAWGGGNWKQFSEEFAKEQTLHLLKNAVTKILKSKGMILDESVLYALSRNMLQATYTKQIG